MGWKWSAFCSYKIDVQETHQRFLIPNLNSKIKAFSRASTFRWDGKSENQFWYQQLIVKLKNVNLIELAQCVCAVNHENHFVFISDLEINNQVGRRSIICSNEGSKLMSTYWIIIKSEGSLNVFVCLLESILIGECIFIPIRWKFTSCDWLYNLVNLKKGWTWKIEYRQRLQEFLKKSGGNPNEFLFRGSWIVVQR